MLKTKQKLKEEFDKYVSEYDMNDKLISYKYHHTFRVADNAEKIAKSLNMSDEEIKIAYLVGLLHDIGRFYQVKKYQTYSDYSSNLDHGDLGYKTLSEGLIRNFIDTDKYDYDILEAVRNHNKIKIDNSKEYNELTLKYIKIARDADKLDILYVISSKMNHTIDYDNLNTEKINRNIIEDLKNRKIVKYSDCRTKVDYVAVFFGYIYDIYFEFTIKYILENDYYRKYIELLNINDETKKIFNQLCNELYQYMNERILKKVN